jgi:hypothetical protein
VIEICLLSLGAALLLVSIGAFLLYVPILPIAVVVTILLGMALTFLIGIWVGSNRALRLRLAKRLRIRQVPAENHIAIPL